MPIKRALTSTIFLKATSLIMGFLFWSIMSDSFVSTVWVTTPLCFYNKSEKKIVAPEALSIELKGKRSYLRRLDKSSLAVHVNAQHLHTGPNNLQVNEDILFLPTTIKVGESIPHNILITVEEELEQ